MSNPPTSTSTSTPETFSILGSSKLNTPDGKNPPTTSTSDATARGAPSLTGIGSGTGTGSGDGDGDGERGVKAGGGGSGSGGKTACQAAHDELEARLRDEELGARSKGWGFGEDGSFEDMKMEKDRTEEEKEEEREEEKEEKDKEKEKAKRPGYLFPSQ